ncbi:MAG: tyrosine-type recombinase/integrase [Pseudomonadota bacterium]
MARANRSLRLENRTNRLKLPAGKRHWVTVGNGIAMCYRRTSEGYGTWQGRAWVKEQYVYQNLGEADDYQNADGTATLDYFQAFDKARQWASESISDSRDPDAKMKAALTVGMASDRYLAWFKEHRKGYRETELAVKAHILPTFKDKLAVELTTKEIRDWLNKVAATPARKRSGKGRKQAYRDKPKTDEEKRARKASANRTLAILKALLNKAFQDELTKDDTAWRRVKPFGKVDEPVVRFLTEAESIRLLNACPADFRLLVRAGLFTGARCSELTGLLVKDVNTDTKQVYIKPAKSGKARYIPLSPDGLDFFKTLTAGKTGEQKVFTKKNGTAWGRNHHVRFLRDACKNGKITPPVTFHDLRHTYASLLAQAGADLLTISKLLGHSDTRVTSRHYAHLCDKTLANAVENFLPSFGHVSDSKVKAIR